MPPLAAGGQGDHTARVAYVSKGAALTLRHRGPPGEYRYEKTLPDGRMAGVMALTFGRARIIVAMPRQTEPCSPGGP